MNKLTWIFIFILLVSLFPIRIFAQQVCQQQDPCAQFPPDKILEQISCYNNAVAACTNARVTLASEVNYMNNQIRITTLKIESIKKIINQLAAEIDQLGNEVARLEEVLTQRSQLLLHRIPESYKRSIVSKLGLLFLSRDFSDLISRTKYLVKVQEGDASILFQVKATQNNFSERKTLREEKKSQQEQAKINLEIQNQKLSEQKRDKEYLLKITQNSEQRYQELLSQARAEYLAILGILAGNGVEQQVGDVNSGDKIASVIAGASCNSGGSHLHFMVVKVGATQNPFNYLKNTSYENCSGSSCGNADGDLFNPSGSWDWPLDPTIKLSQGYGKTWAVTHDPIAMKIYSFHNGIDISGSSYNVKAVQQGTLFRGYFPGMNGCRLQYVKVAHKDSDLSTFYLHVNYL